MSRVAWLAMAGCAGCMPSLERYYPEDAGGGAEGACVAFGAAEVVAEDAAGPGVLLLRGDLIFWLDQETPFGLAKASKLGGGDGTVIVDASRTYSDDSPIFPPNSPPRDLGTDGTLVYWLSVNNQASSIILWADEVGTINGYTAAMEYPSVSRLAVDANNTYFLFETDVYKAPNRQDTQVALAGSTSTLVALASAPADIYFTDVDGTVRKVNKSGASEATVVAQDQGSAFGIAADSAGAYWTTDGGAINAVTGDGSVVTLASNRNAPTEIASDEHAVYWVEPTAGSVMCVPKAGGAPVTLAADQGGPNDVAVDATGVYWVNKSGGQVMARYR